MSSSVQNVHVDVSAARPVVRGTDIKVSRIAWEHEHFGMSADEIVQAHPHLTLADVHAALAYYFDHLDEIHADWRTRDEYIERLRQRGAPTAAEDSNR